MKRHNKCPKCKIKYLTVGNVNGKIFFYCSCGYGEKEYYQELFEEKKKK